MTSHMLNNNAPDHTRLRWLVTAAFTRRRVEQLAPRIQQITDDLLDAMADTAQVDLIDSFAHPQRRVEFHHWSSIVVTGLLPAPTPSSRRAPQW